MAQFYAQVFNYPKLEASIKKLVALAPDQPEPRYDLAALQAILGNSTEALQNLKIALDMSAERLTKTPVPRPSRRRPHGQSPRPPALPAPIPKTRPAPVINTAAPVAQAFRLLVVSWGPLLLNAS